MSRIDKSKNRVFRGPWVPIEPWAKWVEEALATFKANGEGRTQEAFAELLGVTERCVYRWIRRGSEYVRLDLIENALWYFDCLHYDDVIGVPPVDEHPRHQRLREQRKRNQQDRKEEA